jgi:hypothetical protein
MNKVKQGVLLRVNWARRRWPTKQPSLLVAGVLVVATVGTGLLLVSRAGTPTVSLEAETGTLNGETGVFNDSTASGGAGVRFGPNGPGGGRTVYVTTSAQLTAAVADAQPGDTINLADGNYTGSLRVGNYTGSFTLVRSGTASAPITLTGSRSAVIDGDGTGGHYGLYIVGANYWNVTGITVTNASKGIVLDGSNHVTFDNIRAYNIGSEALHFRAFSSDNVVKNSLIEQTGVKQAQYGEGVYIGSANSNWSTYSGGQPDASNRNRVLNNVIRNTGAESIDIKEGTVEGVVDGNQFDGVGMQGENSADSWIDVKGNNYTITNNNGVVSSTVNTVFNNGFELHQAVVGWGINNVFYGNTLNLANSTGGSTTTSGFGFYQQKGLTGNILSCDNTVLNAPKGFGVYNVLPQACND